jgi:multiple sugar transport system permease protein
MYNDADFSRSLRFTLLFVAIIIPIQFTLALAMALLVNGQIKGRTIFLFVFAIPLGVSDLTAGLVWSSIFTQNGYLNTILQHLGILDHPLIWIDPSKPNRLLGLVLAAELWRSTALVTIILLAGLQSVPKEYTEAAEVFGAGFFQRLRRVTLPLLIPSLQVALLLRIIFAFEMFATVIAITGTGETTLATQTYRWQQTYLDEHVAAAYATLIVALSLVAGLLVVRFVRLRKEQVL